MRLRHYGSLSAAAKHKLERLRHILGAAPPAIAPPMEVPKRTCPCCNKPMHLSRRVEALPLWRDPLLQRLGIAARAPPSSSTATET